MFLVWCLYLPLIRPSTEDIKALISFPFDSFVEAKVSSTCINCSVHCSKNENRAGLVRSKCPRKQCYKC